MPYIYHLLVEYKSLFRSRNELFISYLFPVLFSFFTGFVMLELNPAFQEIFIASMVIFSVLCVTLLVIPTQIVQDKEAKVFRCYQIYGIKKSSMIGLYIIPGMIHMYILAAVLMLLSPRLFYVLPIEHAGVFISLITIYYLINAFLSIAIGSIAPKTGTATMISLIFFLPTLLLGGVMVPTETLPEKFLSISKFIPSEGVMRIYYSGRGVFLEASSFSIIVLAVWLVIAVVLTHVLFRIDKI